MFGEPLISATTGSAMLVRPPFHSRRIARLSRSFCSVAPSLFTCRRTWNTTACRIYDRVGHVLENGPWCHRPRQHHDFVVLHSERNRRRHSSHFLCRHFAFFLRFLGFLLPRCQVGTLLFAAAETVLLTLAVTSRLVLAIVWFGVNTYTGSQGMYLVLRAMWPSIANVSRCSIIIPAVSTSLTLRASQIPNTLPESAGITTRGMLCYILYWLLQT